MKALILALGLVPPSLADAQDKLPPDAEKAELHARMLAPTLADRYAERNVAGIGELFEAKADLRAPDGSWARGVDEITARYAWELSTGPAKGSRLEFKVESFRFLRPRVAVLDGEWTRTPAGAALKEAKRAKAGKGHGRFVLIATEEDPSWKIAALRMWKATEPGRPSRSPDEGRHSGTGPR